MKILRLGISKGLNFELIHFLPYGLLLGKDKRIAIAFWALLLFEFCIWDINILLLELNNFYEYIK